MGLKISTIKFMFDLGEILYLFPDVNFRAYQNRLKKKALRAALFFRKLTPNFAVLKCRTLKCSFRKITSLIETTEMPALLFLGQLFIFQKSVLLTLRPDFSFGSENLKTAKCPF